MRKSSIIFKKYLKSGAISFILVRSLPFSCFLTSQFTFCICVAASNLVYI